LNVRVHSRIHQRIKKGQVASRNVDVMHMGSLTALSQHKYTLNDYIINPEEDLMALKFLM
jgi:hypothetical protein